jgi:hypothetical protein
MKKTYHPVAVEYHVAKALAFQIMLIFQQCGRFTGILDP